MVNALTERSESSQSENSHTETINTTVPNHTKDKKLPRHIPETSNTRDHILADTGCYPKKTKKKNNISEELLIRLTTPTISTANKMANPLHPTSLAKRKQLSSLLYNNSKP